MTQDYEQEINLIDLLGYMLCHWKWVVVCLLCGGVLGGILSYCTPQAKLEAKYEKETVKLTDTEMGNIEMLYDNFQLLKEEQEKAKAELQTLREQQKKGTQENQDLAQTIVEKETLLSEKTALLSQYLTQNIRGLSGESKTYYEYLVKWNEEGIDNRKPAISYQEFVQKGQKKNIAIGLFAGLFLSMCVVGANYLLKNVVRTGEDFAAFANTILLADFSHSEKKSDFIVKWGVILRDMSNVPTEVSLALTKEYLQAILEKESMQNIFIVTDGTLKTDSALETIRKSLEEIPVQVASGDFLQNSEGFTQMEAADGILLWVQRDQSKYNAWKNLLTVTNKLEKKVIGAIVE